MFISPLPSCIFLASHAPHFSLCNTRISDQLALPTAARLNPDTLETSPSVALVRFAFFAAATRLLHTLSTLNNTTSSTQPPACINRQKTVVQAVPPSKLNYSRDPWTVAAAASLAGAAQRSEPRFRLTLTLTHLLKPIPSLTRLNRALPSHPPCLHHSGWHTRHRSEGARPGRPAA